MFCLFLYNVEPLSIVPSSVYQIPNLLNLLFHFTVCRKRDLIYNCSYIPMSKTFLFLDFLNNITDLDLGQVCILVTLNMKLVSPEPQVLKVDSDTEL